MWVHQHTQYTYMSTHADTHTHQRFRVSFAHQHYSLHKNSTLRTFCIFSTLQFCYFFSYPYTRTHTLIRVYLITCSRQIIICGNPPCTIHQLIFTIHLNFVCDSVDFRFLPQHLCGSHCCNTALWLLLLHSLLIHILAVLVLVHSRMFSSICIAPLLMCVYMYVCG